MKNKSWYVFVVAAVAVAILVSSTEATDLFEPYLKVYGTIRPAIFAKRGTSVGHAESYLDKIFLNIDKDFAKGKFGFHTQTLYHQEGFGQFPNEVWLNEGYFYYKPDFGKIKIGKIFTPFGIVWDHTFYGPILYYKGFMCDPDFGLTFERTETINKKIDLLWKAGYFVREDDLNGQTALGEGFEYTDRGERNTFVARLNPSLKISEKSSLALGMSGLIGEIKADESDRQAALEFDAVYTLGPLTVTGEYIFYDRAYPSKDDTLKGDCYLLEANLGVYKNEKSKVLKKIALNYNYSRDNPDDGQTLGQMHLPSVTFSFTDFFRTEILYVDWSKDGQSADRRWFMVFYVDF